MTKENNKLLKAQNELGKNLKPFVSKIINKNKDLRKDRDSIIKFVYDYIQILKIEVKDTVMKNDKNNLKTKYKCVLFDKFSEVFWYFYLYSK